MPYRLVKASVCDYKECDNPVEHLVLNSETGATVRTACGKHAKLLLKDMQEKEDRLYAESIMDQIGCRSLFNS